MPRRSVHIQRFVRFYWDVKAEVLCLEEMTAHGMLVSRRRAAIPLQKEEDRRIRRFVWYKLTSLDLACFGGHRRYILPSLSPFQLAIAI